MKRSAASRAWAALPRGRFTGVEWSNPQAMDHADPYLAWAETSGFAGFRSPQGASADPHWLPLLIELAPGTPVSELVARSHETWLQVPCVYQQWGTQLRYCTARAQHGFFDALRPGGALHGLVRRYELGLPVGHHAQGLGAESCARSVKGAGAHVQQNRIGGRVMIVIDSGIALGHSDFLDASGRSRVAAFWRQDATMGPHGRAAASMHPVPLDPARAGPAPGSLGYGHELDRAQIQGAIDAHTSGGRLDEDGLYRHLQMWELNHTFSHGTHVASLAAGPRTGTQTIGAEDSPPDWTAARDPAAEATLIAVQLDWASVADSSGGALNVSVLDALAYALSRCASDAQVIVNLSWGALAGPHNGSAMLEAAMSQLMACSGVDASLVMPAGNGYQARTHANTQLLPGDELTLHWRIQPDDHSQSFLELWFEDAVEPAQRPQGIQLELTPPGQRPALKPLSIGHSGVWPSAERPQCAVLFPARSALGEPGTCALIALAPTATWFRETVLSQPGLWQVTLRNTGLRAVVMDAYIERDDVALGSAPTGARQSYLEDPRYDTSGGLGSFIDHPDNPTPVRRSGTFNDIATGAGTVSVGGIRYFDSCIDPMARYSPRQPDPDAGRPERARVKKVPERFAVSDESVALWGVRGAGTRSASAVRLVGTSFAAPQVARDLLNAAKSRKARAR